ncbi:alpha/beta hydrolase [Leucobacter tenebrionis]|uniref:alpha/beta hydrolase n=1 Tax=Leucobacter tenebrionis TaxID=2873270 RepID=UPI001CA72E74|nr:alpha/beta hydrolase [Leucobacter tenebrionis]QZY51773.1 alpha/beta hydrolase [Leucobacter tenebrionis]
MESITFPNGPIDMAGNLFKPEGFDASKRYPAIVTVHPGGGVKEQTAGLYAEKLAARGYVTLAFDASHQGESGGEPRHLEDPYARVEDVRAAVDYLQTLDFVDAERIGALGVCAGGGYAVNAAMTDYRIKALTTVSAVNIGASFRRDWYGQNPDSAGVPTLQAVAQQRTAEAQGADIAYIPYVPVEPDENTPADMVEANEYYLTPRACHANAGNKFPLTRSVSRIFTFDAFHLVEDLLQQPLLVVAGSNAGSLWMSTELHGRARVAGKEFMLVDGATHMALYDVPEYVDPVAAKAAEFFGTHLAAAE